MSHNLLKEIELGSKSALQKKKIITHYIYNGGSTIVDLSKELSLSVPTVTKLINEMCEEGYIRDYGKLETEGGRHPTLYGLNPASGYFVGVDIKKFTLDIGLINFKGDVVDLHMALPYKFENTPEAMDNLCEIIKDFIRNTSEERSGSIMNICVNPQELDILVLLLLVVDLCVMTKLVIQMNLIAKITTPQILVIVVKHVILSVHEGE